MVPRMVNITKQRIRSSCLCQTIRVDHGQVLFSGKECSQEFVKRERERERERWRVCFHNNEISNVYGFIENASPPIPQMLPSIFKLK